MKVAMSPIGYVRTTSEVIPRHWTISRVEGEIVLDPAYRDGLGDIQVGAEIIVLFWFHKSPPFQPNHLIQNPSHLAEPKGVFSICSPIRPNPIGLSIVTVLERTNSGLRVRGIDMFDGTPVLDIKPMVARERNKK